jgi:hypothetical protein
MTVPIIETGITSASISGKLIEDDHATSIKY